MRRDLVPAPHRILGQQWQALDGSPRGADGRLRAVPLQHIHDAPPAGAAAVFEMAVDRRVGPTDETLLDFVDGLVLAVAIGDGVFGALLEIDDERDRDPRAARPARVGRRPGITEQITARNHHMTPSFCTSSRTSCLMLRSIATNSGPERSRG